MTLIRRNKRQARGLQNPNRFLLFQGSVCNININSTLVTLSGLHARWGDKSLGTRLTFRLLKSAVLSYKGGAGVAPVYPPGGHNTFFFSQTLVVLDVDGYKERVGSV